VASAAPIASAGASGNAIECTSLASNRGNTSSIAVTPRFNQRRGQQRRGGYRLAEMETLDTLDRPLRDLRISVTDRCNFRCTYCMPKEVYGRDHRFLDRRELLTFEEITRVARTFVALGTRKLRITGGEPLLRRDVERLVEQLAGLGVDLTLTTNASLLALKAGALAAAGLQRVTVSLDALDDATFRALNDVDFPVERVLEGIDAAVAAGLPVKVNAVIKRGVNDDQIVPMAAFFKERGQTLRFIEYMDVGHTNGWRLDDVVPASEIVASLDEAFGVEAVQPSYRGEVANRWRYRDGSGEVGVIASVTQPFCGDCTRARLSAEGKVYTCLFAVRGTDLRALVRGGASDDDLGEAVRSIWSARVDRYSELRSAATNGLQKVEMSYIGG
jgi:cyclic pyranopterin phosphate synthase